MLRMRQGFVAEKNREAECHGSKIEVSRRNSLTCAIVQVRGQRPNDSDLLFIVPEEVQAKPITTISRIAPFKMAV